jgi:hypothetical protein
MSKISKFVVPALLAAPLAACSGNAADEVAQKSSAAATVTLNTFIGQSIQIDQLAPGSLAAEDANLFVGADPADGTSSEDAPTGGPSPFIDWDDLASSLDNHRLLDLDGAKGRDPTAFPRANECVSSANVLSKMDLTYIASANNNKFAYFAVQRSDNNGDAGYYWVFTKKEPRQVQGEAPCASDEYRLLYDVSVGDVLLAGHFKPNGSPLLRVFKATAAQNGVTAVDAVDFTSSLWAEDAASMAAVAVNTTPTAPGAFGAAGVKGMSGSNLDKEIFAEAAVKLSLFAGEGSLCGQTYFGSVITRSSGSGGTSPDLKDLAGPALFNFGGTEASATLTAGCDNVVTFDATAKGPDGQPLENGKCSWVFDNDPSKTADTCSGTITLPAGAHTGTVTVQDPVSTCSDTKTTAQANVYDPLSLSAELSGTCNLQLGYKATLQGGSPNATYGWKFSSNSGTAPDASGASGTVTASAPGTYTGTVIVTDTHDGITCTKMANAQAPTYAPLSVALAAVAKPAACMDMSSDAVTFRATPTGGSGSVTYGWNGWSGVGCSNGLSTDCIVDPADSAFCVDVSLSVTATDPVCGTATSPEKTYKKRTTVEAP